MKTRRHAKILELIKAQDIDTQEELLRNLRACGFDATQATVSRDIKELRLVKSLSPNGKYKYSTGRDNARDISSKFYSFKQYDNYFALFLFSFFLENSSHMSNNFSCLLSVILS